MKKKFIIILIIVISIVISILIVIYNKNSDELKIQAKCDINKNIDIVKSNEKIDENVFILDNKKKSEGNTEVNIQEVENEDEPTTDVPIKTNNEIKDIPVQNENKTQIKEQQNKQEQVVEVKKEPNIPKCTEIDHNIGVGNSNKWFNSKEEAINYYNDLIRLWGDKWERFEIDSETYDKNCPYGYEVLTCPTCSKWTINFYYR